jgi:hypothetical protein
MKVIETTQYTSPATGEVSVSEMSWGENMEPLDVVMAVTSILNHQKDRDNGDVHVFQGRLKTLAIRVEL